MEKRSGARPSDFAEASVAGPLGLVGQDDVWADAATLAVYAGHSDQDYMVFGASEAAPGGNVCQLQFSNQDTQLGILSGKKTRVSMFLSSCIGYMDDSGAFPNEQDFFAGVGKNNSWEYLAFFDSAYISTFRPKMFVECVGGSKGYGAYDGHCWLDTMWFYSPQVRSQPVFFSTGRSDETTFELNARHEESNFLDGAHLPPTPATAFNPAVDNMYWTSVFTDGIPSNEDPEPSECQSNFSH